ncbi:MAG: protein translocase subunit SecF [Clostridia bacterium]|nr:protein translocase subunit SecF [Clostridia bacterium]
MKTLNVTKNKTKTLLVPLAIIVIGLIMFFIKGFNFDIEFLGGIRMEVAMDGPVNTSEISDYLEQETGVNPIIVQTTSSGISIKTQPIEEEVKNQIFEKLQEKYNLDDDAMLSVSSASASYGKQTQGKTVLFTLIAMLCILIYIAIRFEWRSAVTAIVSLFINILVMMAVYAIFQIPLNTTFIAAMLTVVGYSINDTIVIFDRIRDNMRGYNAKKNGTVSDVVNRSINECIGRTICTSITTLVTILLLFIIGVSAVKEFALPLLIGITCGTFTSMFVATPFWGAWKDAEAEAKAAAKRK